MALLETRIESGLVRGTTGWNQAITIFKGVPFAAPPVGDLRWKAPQPCQPWEGVRPCIEWASMAMQEGYVSEGGGIIGTEFYVGNYQKSEDCLYLNIWTPAESPDEKLPVAVYIHGGGHQTGYSYLNCYDGEGFAKRGIVMVTIPYRLNVFGNLAHPELTAEGNGYSSNYGLRDQVAAFEWIHRNIAAFGGDPENVTVFGQSGGASSVQAMCTSPLTNDLIHRAIMQSGGGLRKPYSMWSANLQNAEEAGIKFFEFMGFKNLAEARAASAEEILDGYTRFNQVKIRDDEEPGMGGKYMRFAPLLADGYIFPENPIDICLKGNHKERDYMLTSTSGEGIMTTVQNLAFAENELKLGRKPSYLMYFTYVPPGAENAHHSVEHHYVFQTLLRSHRPYTGFDWELSNELADRWASFMKTGNPNPADKHYLEWTPFTAESPMAYEIAANRRMIKIPETPAMITAKKDLKGEK